MYYTFIWFKRYEMYFSEISLTSSPSHVVSALRTTDITSLHILPEIFYDCTRPYVHILSVSSFFFTQVIAQNRPCLARTFLPNNELQMSLCINTKKYIIFRATLFSSELCNVLYIIVITLSKVIMHILMVILVIVNLSLFSKMLS